MVDSVFEPAELEPIGVVGVLQIAHTLWNVTRR